MLAPVFIQNISKSYGQVRALTDISLTVDQAALFGLIGPDGAGKTSLIRILTTLLKPDTGQASVLSYDVVKEYRHIRRKIGYMPGTFALYQDLTVEENLQFFATVFGSNIKKNYDLIKPIYEQIEPFKDRRAGKLSGGMKQKLALSCALIHRPEILFLDEPTTGVDAVSRQEFWDMLKAMKKHGITVFVSTPYMDEAILCDRVALIQGGTLLDIDAPSGIVSKFKAELWRLKAGDRYGLLQLLRSMPEVEKAYPFGEYTHVTLRKSLDPAKWKEKLETTLSSPVELDKAEPGIEDCFIELMTR